MNSLLAMSTTSNLSAEAKAVAPPIAELCAVNKSFISDGGHALKVLEEIDVAVHEGELLALLGQ